FRAPRGVLGQFVELLWLFDGYVVPHAEERLMPMATTELVVDLREGAKGSTASVVAGPHSEYSVLATSDEFSVIGVHFKPAAAVLVRPRPPPRVRLPTLPSQQTPLARASPKVLAPPAATTLAPAPPYDPPPAGRRFASQRTPPPPPRASQARIDRLSSSARA